MFEFRLNQVRILNNETNPEFLLVGKDFADVKFYSFMTTDGFTFPGLDELKEAETTMDRKREIIKNATRQVAAMRDFPTIAKIKDDHKITFGKYGYVLYRTMRIPEFFDWGFFGIKSNKSARKLGAWMEDVVESTDYDEVTDNVLMLIGGAFNPAYAAGGVIVKFVTKLFSDRLRAKGDGQIGYMLTSFNQMLHYPHGLLNDVKVPDVSGNMLLDYTIFATDPLHVTRKIVEAAPANRAMVLEEAD